MSKTLWPKSEWTFEVKLPIEETKKPSWFTSPLARRRYNKRLKEAEAKKNWSARTDTDTNTPGAGKEKKKKKGFLSSLWTPYNRLKKGINDVASSSKSINIENVKPVKAVYDGTKNVINEAVGSGNGK